MKNLIQIHDKRVIICSIIFSVFLSLAMTLGKAMYTTNDILSLTASLSVAVHFLFMFIGTSLLFFIVTIILFSADLKEYSFHLTKKKTLILYFVLAVFFFLCWTPAYLSYYPGIWSYDINEQVFEAATGKYNMHHPPLHTFILYIFMVLNKWNFSHAIAEYGIFQMLFLSCAFALATITVIKRNCPLVITIICIIFYALNPVLAIFSFIPVKDMMCCGFLTLLILEIVSLAYSPSNYLSKTSNYIRFSAYALFFCLLRNNAIYAFVALFPFAVLLFTKLRKKTLLLFTIPTLLYFSITLILFPALGIEKAKSAEALCVPMQQIANTVTSGNDISEEDLATIDQFLPVGEIADAYNPRFADPIKEIYNGSHGPIYLVKEWLRLLPDHIKEYTNGFLALHIPYWYPNANAVDSFSHAIYIDTNVTVHGVNAPFVNAGLAPKLLAFYEKVATYSAFENLPQFLNIFTLSFPLWFLILSLFRLLAKKKSKALLVVLLPLFFFLTYLLGPVSNLRYIVPIIAQLPIILFITTTPICALDGEALAS